MLNFPVKDCHLRAATMKAIAKHQQRHYVPCFLRTIYCLLERHANGKIISGQFIVVGTGMIDGGNHRFPVYDKILATCRWNPSIAEYENIEKNMTIILHHSCEFGHISDEMYDQIEILQDRDKMGREVMQDAIISQESYQRTKCLTHEHQIHLRKKRLSQNQWIESERKEVANHKHQEKITQDGELVGHLCKQLKVGGLLSDAEIGTVNEE